MKLRVMEINQENLNLQPSSIDNQNVTGLPHKLDLNLQFQTNRYKIKGPHQDTKDLLWDP